MRTRHRIQFPPQGSHKMAQDETFFHLVEGDRKLKLRFHDYDKIYERPGLYEQVFYERLKCSSPQKVGELLRRAVAASDKSLSALRVLDLGAGNGLMGEELKKDGVARMVGADIIREAKIAADRDRPGVYDEYYVADFTDLSDDLEQEIADWNFDCLTSVAALGFGDIPPAAFFQALQFVQVGGWVAFNIKATFLDKSDRSGFSRFVRELIFTEYLDICHMERYRHRLSMEGLPLHYYALVAQKSYDIPDDFLDSLEIEETADV
ncbi:MAG: methyltransferase [Planctomycetaceae bacterium]|nr:methyltransferase [Planctomycetaceae bacterium]